jgi:hypothetical protein
MIINFSKTIIFGTLFLNCNCAHADIYEFIDETGVVHYSDFASNDECVLIMKSPAPELIADTKKNEGVTNTGSNAKGLTPSELLAQIDASAQQMDYTFRVIRLA